MPPPAPQQPDSDDIQAATQRLIRQLTDAAASTRPAGPAVSAVALTGLADLQQRAAKLLAKIDKRKATPRR